MSIISVYGDHLISTWSSHYIAAVNLLIMPHYTLQLTLEWTAAQEWPCVIKVRVWGRLKTALPLPFPINWRAWEWKVKSTVGAGVMKTAAAFLIWWIYVASPLRNIFVLYFHFTASKISKCSSKCTLVSKSARMMQSCEICVGHIYTAALQKSLCA